MEDLILILVLALILGGVSFYLIRAKKRGQKCVGCPDSCGCAGKTGCAGCSGCGTQK